MISGDLSKLDSSAKIKAFKFYILHGLVRHLSDCEQILKDLIKLDSHEPALSIDTLLDDLVYLADMKMEINSCVPNVGNWIEVPEPTAERTHNASSSSDSNNQSYNGGVNQDQTNSRRSPKIT